MVASFFAGLICGVILGLVITVLCVARDRKDFDG